jgi:GDPmannose 4,6-dehydratase
VATLLGDPSKAREKLGWIAEIGFSDLVSEMVSEDLAEAKRDAMIAKEGYRIYSRHE